MNFNVYLIFHIIYVFNLNIKILSHEIPLLKKIFIIKFIIKRIIETELKN